MPRKIGRNEPCWCGSGKKYKKCHHNRIQATPPPISATQDAIKREFRSKRCMHAEAGTHCSGKIVRAHTVSEKSALALIAREGKVYSTLVKPNLAESDGECIRLLGLRKASIFYGFCKRHDSGTFKRIDNEQFDGSAEVAFLYYYRSLCKELYLKEAAVRYAQHLREMDCGLTFPEQLELQSELSCFAHTSQLGVNDLQTAKTVADSMLISRQYGECRFLAYEFNRSPEFVCSGVFAPDVDFDGNQLQDFDNPDKPLDQICVTLVPNGSNSLLILAWVTDQSDACARFALSFDSIVEHMKPHATVKLCFSRIENTFLKPSWWESLSSECKAYLRILTRSGASDAYSSLKDDGTRLISWPRMRLAATNIVGMPSLLHQYKT